MSLYSERGKPIVMIRVNGEPSQDFMDSRIRWSFTDRIGKRQTATLELSDPKREFRDGKLVPDDHYQISWGWPGNMSRARNFRLKEWSTNHDTGPHRVTLTLKDTGLPPSKFQGSEFAGTEMHETSKPKNWGKMQTSDIAKAIARRHGLTAIVQDSEDIDRYAYIQPGNVSDYGYLRRLAEIIDYEFFTDSAVLYYRAKHHEERPRRVFYFHPQGNYDTLLLSFTPTAKVTSVRTRPMTVDVQLADSPFAAEFRDLSEAAAEIFNVPLDKAEDAVTEITGQGLNDGWANAEQVRLALQKDAGNTELNKEYDTRQRELSGQLRLLQEARVQGASASKDAGKAANVQRTKPLGSRDKGDHNTDAKNQIQGKTPTGSKDVPDYVSVDIPPEKYEVVRTVQTTAGTDEQAGKVAGASHSKRKDKAVTASATFVGDPSLTAKVTYYFEGVGLLFSGKWYAKEATHEVGETYIVTMSLKKGSLNKTKKGTTGNGTSTDAAVHYADTFHQITKGRYDIWSNELQGQYDEITGTSNTGFHTQDGTWIPAPPGTRVPPR